MVELIEPLTWDSEFFGKRTGRLNLQVATVLGDTLLYANQQKYKLLYIYSPVAIDKPLIGNYALLDVGGHITFTADLSDYSFNEAFSVPEICEYQLDILNPEVLEIAFLSGQLSRFKIDPSLPGGSFERLYETWLKKTLENRPRSTIYTYRLDDRIAGLITIELNGSTCTIGLLAVLWPYQGKGIASKLLRYVKDICMNNNILSLEVKTQLSNQNAIALYLKNSFVEQSRSFLYHAHSLGWQTD